MRGIDPTTEIASSIIEGIDQHTPLPINFYVIGTLGSSETITLQYWDGYAWRNANISGNNGVILDANNAVKSLYNNLSTFSKANSKYKSNLKLVKTTTAIAVGVGISVRGL